MSEETLAELPEASNLILLVTGYILRHRHHEQNNHHRSSSTEESPPSSTIIIITIACAMNASNPSMLHVALFPASSVLNTKSWIAIQIVKSSSSSSSSFQPQVFDHSNC